jgi:hypothetical protein
MTTLLVLLLVGAVVGVLDAVPASGVPSAREQAAKPSATATTSRGNGRR